MKQPSSEIIENARKVTGDDIGNCQAFDGDCKNCAFTFVHGIEGTGTVSNSSSQFFKDFLAKYDMEAVMDKDKKIAELEARIAKLEGREVWKRVDTYPCIKQDEDGLTILFTSPGKGVNLSKHIIWPVGNYDDCWDESEFTITLTEYIVKV